MSVSGEIHRGRRRATESGYPLFFAGSVSLHTQDDRDRIVAVMAQRDRPAPWGRYLPSEAVLNSVGNSAVQTQGRASPSISDKLNLAPVDVLGQDNRGGAISATIRVLRVCLAPGLDESLLGRPSGSQVLGRARSLLLRATAGLTELARGEGALCEDGAGLIELGLEVRNMHQVRAHCQNG
ncbi:hypothetical protein HMPREF1129_0630 [Actinomyces naeslundii str. Howell 279]|uniref:Uncharacterized protein n=1 Tax=Actinomyces naeslundii (strain ATCC 12104 / DSM 43013 / CCUG 2238 / JCM 8349 / NCTC 10301 / Howell 279) TaxID=1115803 RepID=J3JK01_ACTNH|nr:hypothetical protein HMPREF1129_0630 [Actinomyces naeslundii str. Howell 279]